MCMLVFVRWGGGHRSTAVSPEHVYVEWTSSELDPQTSSQRLGKLKSPQDIRDCNSRTFSHGSQRNLCPSWNSHFKRVIHIVNAAHFRSICWYTHKSAVPVFLMWIVESNDTSSRTHFAHTSNLKQTQSKHVSDHGMGHASLSDCDTHRACHTVKMAAALLEIAVSLQFVLHTSHIAMSPPETHVRFRTRWDAIYMNCKFWWSP